MVQKAGKNLLFAELIIVILFFSVAAAGCVMLFAEAYKDGAYSRDLSAAMVEAQNAAECFKAAEGDLEKTAELLGYTEKDGMRIHIETEEADGLIKADIFIIGANFIYELTTAVAKGVQQ